MATMAETTKKVLLAIDDSVQAAQTFDWYFRFLHKPDNSVVIVHVPEGPTATMSQGLHLNAGEIQRMIEKEKAETKALQDKYMSKLAEIQMDATYQTVYGKAGEAIVKAGQDLEASMIVMGTRGLGRLRRTVLGSVSDYVVHHAHCPAIVFRQ